MVDPKEMLATLVDRFAVTAKVQNVFGEPIESHGKTIIPVARVSYRLGAGGGGRERPDSAGVRSGVAAEAAAAWFRLFLPGWSRSRKRAPASCVSSIPKWLPDWSPAGLCSACCCGGYLAESEPARSIRPIQLSYVILSEDFSPS